MKIVVTGSSGYVGSFLLPALLQRPDVTVVGIDRAAGPLPSADRLTFIRADLSFASGQLDAGTFSNVDAVVHLAAARGDWAITAKEYWRDNVDATRGLLALPWAARVPCWIFMSSVSVYGPSAVPLDETAACAPVGPYGESKLASEQLFDAFIEQHGLRGCVIRPSAIFSPGHPANTNVYKLVESLRSFPLPLLGGGRNRKTLTYLPNLIELIFWALERLQACRLPHRTYNYVEEPVQIVSELIAILKAAGIAPARIIPIPMAVAIAAALPVYAAARIFRVDLRVTPERVRKFAASTWYDAARVRADGFAPGTSFLQAVEATARWHLAHRPVDSQ